MRVNRSMFVGLLALIAAVGMLGVNGYYWWLSNSRQTDALQESPLSNVPSQKSGRPHALTEPVWNEAELWESPYRDPVRQPAHPTPTRQFFPEHHFRVEIAQADALDGSPVPAEKDASESAPPPLLLPDSPTPIAEPPVHDWLRELVKQELPEATVEERGVWSQELRGLDPEMARAILRMRKSVRNEPAMPRVVTRPNSVPDLPLSAVPHAPSPENLVPPPHEMPTTETPSIAHRLEQSLQAFEDARNVVLNNLVNVHTPGFKRMRVVLTERSYEFHPEYEPNNEETLSTSVGSGVTVACTLLDVSQGPLQETNQPLDIAIQGRGFFQVRVGDEIQYTRFGMAGLNEKGELCILKGNKLCPLEPSITITETREPLIVSSDGTVSGQVEGNSDLHSFGRFSLVRFPNPSRLKPVRNQFYQATKASGRPVVARPEMNGLGSLMQGFLESSNVSRNEELEQVQQFQTHLQLLNQLAASQPGEFLPGPVARRPQSRTKRTSAEMSPVPPRALKSFLELKDQSRNLIDEYLQSQRVQTIRRTLGWK